jgi:hypothetical protein
MYSRSSGVDELTRPYSPICLKKYQASKRKYYDCVDQELDQVKYAEKYFICEGTLLQGVASVSMIAWALVSDEPNGPKEGQ